MWYAALVMGFAGSLHCLGMCSPLTLAVTSLRSPLFLHRVLYNTGRILTYGTLGAFVSVFGSFFRLSDYQQGLSLGLGGLLIVLGFVGISKVQVPVLSKGLTQSTGWLKKRFSYLLQRKSSGSVMLMGALNGLLPCGLTYIALSYCIILPSAISGFGYMVFFGAGTLPVMLGMTGLVQKIMTTYRISFRGITTFVLITLGIMLISRSFMLHHRVETAGTAAIEVCD